MKICYPVTKRTLQQYTDQNSDDDWGITVMFP